MFTCVKINNIYSLKMFLSDNQRENKLCPACIRNGRQTKLELCQINLTEAIYMCKLKECIYPLGYECILVKRNILDTKSSSDSDSTDSAIEKITKLFTDRARRKIKKHSCLKNSKRLFSASDLDTESEDENTSDLVDKAFNILKGKKLVQMRQKGCFSNEKQNTDNLNNSFTEILHEFQINPNNRQLQNKKDSTNSTKIDAVDYQTINASTNNNCISKLLENTLNKNKSAVEKFDLSIKDDNCVSTFLGNRTNKNFLQNIQYNNELENLHITTDVLQDLKNVSNDNLLQNKENYNETEKLDVNTSDIKCSTTNLDGSLNANLLYKIGPIQLEKNYTNIKDHNYKTKLFNIERKKFELNTNDENCMSKLLEDPLNSNSIQYMQLNKEPEKLGFNTNDQNCILNLLKDPSLANSLERHNSEPEKFGLYTINKKYVSKVLQDSPNVDSLQGYTVLENFDVGFSDITQNIDLLQNTQYDIGSEKFCEITDNKNYTLNVLEDRQNENFLQNAGQNSILTPKQYNIEILSNDKLNIPIKINVNNSVFNPTLGVNPHTSLHFNDSFSNEINIPKTSRNDFTEENTNNVKIINQNNLKSNIEIVKKLDRIELENKLVTDSEESKKIQTKIKSVNSIQLSESSAANRLKTVSSHTISTSNLCNNAITEKQLQAVRKLVTNKSGNKKICFINSKDDIKPDLMKNIIKIKMKNIKGNIVPKLIPQINSSNKKRTLTTNQISAALLASENSKKNNLGNVKSVNIIPGKNKRQGCMPSKDKFEGFSFHTEIVQKSVLPEKSFNGTTNHNSLNTCIKSIKNPVEIIAVNNSENFLSDQNTIKSETGTVNEIFDFDIDKVVSNTETNYDENEMDDWLKTLLD